MPRIAGTKEKFKSISIEQSLFEEIHKQQRIGEPIYITVRRMLHQADDDDTSGDTIFASRNDRSMPKLEKQMFKYG